MPVYDPILSCSLGLLLNSKSEPCFQDRTLAPELKSKKLQAVAAQFSTLTFALKPSRLKVQRTHKLPHPPGATLSSRKMDPNITNLRLEIVSNRYNIVHEPYISSEGPELQGDPPDSAAVSPVLLRKSNGFVVSGTWCACTKLHPQRSGSRFRRSCTKGLQESETCWLINRSSKA